MLTFSALVVAGYIAVMYLTQGFAFGPYQIRIASAFYALAYPFPFLILPIALANTLANALIGGLGVPDIVGGFAIGVITAGLVALPRKLNLPMWLVIPPIILAPGFIVPLWLSPIYGLPYWPLVLSISIGQTLPAILGYILIQALAKRKMGEDL